MSKEFAPVAGEETLPAPQEGELQEPLKPAENAEAELSAWYEQNGKEDPTPPSLAHVRAKMAQNRLARGQGIPEKRPPPTAFLPASLKTRLKLSVRGAKSAASKNEDDNRYIKAAAIGRAAATEVSERRPERPSYVRPSRSGRR